MWTTLDAFISDYERASLGKDCSSPEKVQAIQKFQRSASLEDNENTSLSVSSSPEKVQAIQVSQSSASREIELPTRS